MPEVGSEGGYFVLKTQVFSEEMKLYLPVVTISQVLSAPMFTVVHIVEPVVEHLAELVALI